jgi:hypothetical protein
VPLISGQPVEEVAVGAADDGVEDKDDEDPESAVGVV